MNLKSLCNLVFIACLMIHARVHAAQYQAQVITDELSLPWAIAVLPDNALFITEREGRLRHFSNGNLSESVSGVPDVYFAGQGGLLDVLLDPDFTRNQRIYLSLVTGARAITALQSSLPFGIKTTTPWKMSKPFLP